MIPSTIGWSRRSKNQLSDGIPPLTIRCQFSRISRVRLLRRLKYRLRRARRRRMKPSRRAIPAAVVPSASSTIAPGPSNVRPSKTDAIIHPKTGLRLALRPALIAAVSAYFLSGGQAEIQSASPGSCGKLTDLVEYAKVFRSRAEEQMTADVASNRETQLGPTGGLPLNRAARQVVA